MPDVNMTERERVNQTSRPEISQISPEGKFFDDQLEEQYHPGAAFDIFASGDPLKKKFNYADDLIDEEDDEDGQTDQGESQGIS